MHIIFEDDSLIIYTSFETLFSFSSSVKIAYTSLCAPGHETIFLFVEQLRPTIAVNISQCQYCSFSPSEKTATLYD